MNQSVLQVNDLCLRDILHNVSFELADQEMLAIMGPSGSGKSTLLYAIAGMEKADQGHLVFDDHDLVELTEDKRASLRLHQMGFVFQNMNMMARLNLLDNILLPVLETPMRKQIDPDTSKPFTSRKKRRNHYQKQARHFMNQLEIADLADRKINEVSGGQLQRACIVRALMNQPRLLLADEPTGALNKAAAQDVLHVLNTLNRQGMTILLVTHDRKVASQCDRILYLLDGQIQGELKLGKFKESDERAREEQVSTWLQSMGW